MMKPTMILLFVLISFTTKSQISFSINELNVYNINIVVSKNTYNEGAEDGPIIDGLFTIKNNTDSCVTIYPSKSNIQILFSFMEKQYSTNLYPLSFMENDTIILSPLQKEEVSFGTNLLLGTDILNTDKKNYTYELLQILPTIRISYKDKKLNIKTTEIQNVKIW